MLMMMIIINPCFHPWKSSIDNIPTHEVSWHEVMGPTAEPTWNCFVKKHHTAVDHPVWNQVFNYWCWQHFFCGCLWSMCRMSQSPSSLAWSYIHDMFSFKVNCPRSANRSFLVRAGADSTMYGASCTPYLQHFTNLVARRHTNKNLPKDSSAKEIPEIPCPCQWMLTFSASSMSMARFQVFI